MSNSRDRVPGTRGDRRPHRQAADTGGQYWMLLLFTALIIAGSLYPYEFSLPDSQAAAWAGLFDEWFPGGSQAEMLGEVALFAVYGFAGIYAIPSSLRPALQAAAVALLAFALAALRQLSQIYAAPWEPALGDIVLNLGGAALGVSAGLYLRKYSPSGNENWQRACVPIVVLLLWLAAELLPFIPTFSPPWIKDVVRGLLRRPVIAPIEALWHMAGVLVAGRALTEILGKARALVVLVALTGAIAAFKVLIVSKVLTASALAGFAAGLLLWGWLSRWRHGWSVDLLLMALLGAAYTLTQLEPFDVRPGAAPINWNPFAGMEQGLMLAHIQALAGSAFVFAAVLGLVRMQGSGMGATGIVLACWTAMLAVTQMFIAGRNPGVTELMLVLLVASTLQRVPGPGGRNPRQSAPEHRAPP